MVLFSTLYEQACGATYSLVPFVSNRSPGLVSGFVAAGGTAGFEGGTRSCEGSCAKKQTGLPQRTPSLHIWVR